MASVPITFAPSSYIEQTADGPILKMRCESVCDFTAVPMAILSGVDTEVTVAIEEMDKRFTELTPGMSRYGTIPLGWRNKCAYYVALCSAATALASVGPNVSLPLTFVTQDETGFFPAREDTFTVGELQPKADSLRTYLDMNLLSDSEGGQYQISDEAPMAQDPAA